MNAIDENSNSVASVSEFLPKSEDLKGHLCQQPENWWRTVHKLFKTLLTQIDPSQVRAISVNGTSGTVFLVNENGEPISPAYMYNDDHNEQSAKRIAEYAPQNSGAHGRSSGLAKCLTLLKEYAEAPLYRCLNQADWIAGKLVGKFDFSDENNSLKMGYDPIRRNWPEWLENMECLAFLPQHIFEPGQIIDNVSKDMATQYGFDNQTKIVAGTTDSIAAFIATGSSKIGDAVSSLGSTLAIKLISEKPIFSAEYGVYSHRLGNTWLVGGASNSGGTAILRHFNQAQIDLLSQQLAPEKLTGLNYYPLPTRGERFPIYDPKKESVTQPRPEEDVEFLQAILEGIARIEKQAYDRLAELGAVYPQKILTMGGGSRNDAWRKIREQFCQCPVLTAKHSEAAYGSALLAQKGYVAWQKQNTPAELQN